MTRHACCDNNRAGSDDLPPCRIRNNNAVPPAARDSSRQICRLPLLDRRTGLDRASSAAAPRQLDMSASKRSLTKSPQLLPVSRCTTLVQSIFDVIDDVLGFHDFAVVFANQPAD